MVISEQETKSFVVITQKSKVCVVERDQEGRSPVSFILLASGLTHYCATMSLAPKPPVEPGVIERRGVCSAASLEGQRPRESF